VEAAHPMSWYRWVGDAGEIIGIDHFGASADYKTLYEKFGITSAAVVAAARFIPREDEELRSAHHDRADSTRRAQRGRRVHLAGRPVQGTTSTRNNLAELIRDSHVVGVTTNPTIFANALSHGDAYSAQMRDLAARARTVGRRCARPPCPSAACL